MQRKRPLELEKVLEVLIDQLKKQGMIDDNIDTMELVKQTHKNLENTLGEGNLPHGDLLKDPAMLMKLSLSILATHRKPAKPELIKNIFDLQTPQQLEEIAKELDLEKPFLKFMQLCMGAKNEETPADDPEKNMCMGLYDALGTLIDRYENVFAVGPAKGNKFQTEEEASEQAVQLKEGTEDRLDSLANTPGYVKH